MARETEQQKRERALMAAFARGKVQKDFQRDLDIAMALGIPETSFSRYKKDAFMKVDFYKFCQMARKLGFTGRELCAIVGVPYES